MVPLIVLVVSFLISAAAGSCLFRGLAECLACGVGRDVSSDASAHWEDGAGSDSYGSTRFRRWWKVGSLTGVAEMLIAVGLQIPQAAISVAVMAAMMLTCVFPPT